MCMSRTISTLQKGNRTWFLFNLIGIRIEDQFDWSDFIFDDATLVNKSQFKKMTDSFSNFKDNYPDFDSDTTYLLVQSFGKISKDVHLLDNEMQNKAVQRAYEVAGFINLVFQYLTNHKYSIVLEKQYNPKYYSRLKIFSNYGHRSRHESFTNGEFKMLSPKQPFVFSRTNLLKIFNSERFTSLYEIVKSKSKKSKHIKSAITNFYLNINIPNSISQLLGSVTTLEILLKDETSYSNFRKRLETIIDPRLKKLVIKDSKDSIIDKRHEVIHEGAICDKNFAQKAIILTTITLLNYSNFYDINKSKKEFCENIDSKLRLKHINDFNTSIYKLTDITLPHIFNFVGLSSVENIKNIKENFLKSVLCYQNIKKIDVKPTWSIVTNFYYFGNNPFPIFEEFKQYYNENKKRFEIEVKEYLKYIKYYLSNIYSE